jgi:hypothetical protein
MQLHIIFKINLFHFDEIILLDFKNIAIQIQ